ncbi:MAG: class I SAM-dependent methyltransferase [Myxococcales bacterium]|nr:class I SAM-dependent methyltransferase [Myxococcales bacterium]
MSDHHRHGPQDVAFWDQMWSHRATRRDEPHHFLAESAAALIPGAALDVGCGEGTDALWLATRGWTVTAVDVSKVALDRARSADRAQRVTWIHANLDAWRPPFDTYDLVVAQFLHVPPGARASFFDGLARAIRLGGTLLFSAHAPPGSGTTVDRPAIADLYFSADEVVRALPGRWEVVIAGEQARVAHTHDGPRQDHDTVVNARRIG